MALTQTVASASTANIFAAPRTHMGAAPPPRPTPQERIKAYRDFLTPALHRRFVKAAGLVLFFCLAESWLLSNSRHFIWSWFPIGPAGARALLLFIPCLAVFIVRLANIHIGERTAASSAGMVWKQIAGAKGIAGTLHTMGWYMISAFFFGEVYIWSSSDKDELNMVDPGRTYERPRLNENPIAMRCTFLTLAVIQSVLHLVRDYDQVDIAPKERDETQKPRWMTILFGPSPNILDRLPTSIRVLAEQSGAISHKSFNLSIGTVFIASPSVYYFGLRKPVWSATYFFAKIFFHNLPAYAPPTGVMHIQKLFLQMFVACFMLVFLWEASNTVFGIFVAQPPVKKGKPLTSEIKDGRGVVLARSKDPNGSLLTGLKSKKEVPRNFAFWELYIICTKFDRRRKTIYTEVERKDGSTWSQVCKFCLEEVKSITQRIKDFTEPLDYKKKQQEAEQLKKYQEYHMALAEEDTGLKRIADQGVIIDGDVYQRRKPDFANTISGLARSVGSHPGAENPVLPHARKAIRDVASRLPEDQKRLFDPRYVEDRATGYFAELLKSPLGQPFRQTFARRAVTTIFGTPNSKKAAIIQAVKSLTTLAVSSLKEDDYGQVQKDVANIIRTFTEVIKAIEKYIRAMKPHKTDVEFMEGRDRSVAEVEELLTILKESLEAIVLVFGEYADNLGISKKELREAREASARPVVDPAAGVVGGPEMAQAR